MRNVGKMLAVENFARLRLWMVTDVIGSDRGAGATMA
jgi:hypothetical protein